MRIYIVLMLVCLMNNAGFQAEAQPILANGEPVYAEFSDISVRQLASLNSSKAKYEVYFTNEENTYKESLQKLPANRLKALKPKYNPKTRDITFTDEYSAVTWKNVSRDVIRHYLKDSGSAFLSPDGKIALILSQFGNKFGKKYKSVMLAYDEDKGAHEVRQDDIVTKKDANRWPFSSKAISNNAQFLAFISCGKLWLVDYAKKHGKDAQLLDTHSKYPSNVYFSDNCAQLTVEYRKDKPQTFDLTPKSGTLTSYESIRTAIIEDPSAIE